MGCGKKKKQTTATLKCLQKALKEEKVHKNEFQKVWESTLMVWHTLMDFPSTKAGAAWRLQRGKGQNWKGDYVQSSSEKFFSYYSTLDTELLLSYIMSQSHTDIFFPNSSPQFLITSSTASSHYPYPMAELLESFWIKSIHFLGLEDALPVHSILANKAGRVFRRCSRTLRQFQSQE